MRFERVDFAVLYVGGNDLESNMDPQEICDIKALIVQRDVAPVVLVFKVLPRCLEDADAEQKMQKRRLLNRKLTATLKRMPCAEFEPRAFQSSFENPPMHLPCIAPPPRCGVQDGSSSCGTLEEAKKGPLCCVSEVV
ncbi:uncharacterized protein LOC142567807 [Dermacentor variabilis]|uniref:uncharacterized protein LOC142567807 n=1 Tax=Dermacentor variabilis TaxID=34621 RepID=UPI003F5C6943